MLFSTSDINVDSILSHDHISLLIQWIFAFWDTTPWNGKTVAVVISSAVQNQIAADNFLRTINTFNF